MKLAAKALLIPLGTIKRTFTAAMSLSLAFILGCSGILGLAAGLVPAAAALADATPDLIIDTITWSPENPAIGNTVTFSVTVKNQGGGGAGATQVSYYVDNAYLSSSPVNPIAAGASVTKTFTRVAEAGSHDIRAMADSENQVAESDEANNGKTFTYSTLAPDLIVEAITWTPENPSKDDLVSFTVTLKNRGSSRAGSSRVYFYIDDASRGYENVQVIEPGATGSAVFTWSAKAGSHAIRAVADGALYVVESDETNNEKKITFATQPPDLIIEEVDWAPDNPSKSDNVTFTFTIKNQGSGRADYSKVDLYIDDALLDSFQLDPLASGASANATFIWTIRAGSHDIRAVADAKNQLVESDETNNERETDFAPMAPDLVIESLAWTPEKPSKGDVLTFTVTIRNLGGGRSDPSRGDYYVDGAYRGYYEVPEIETGATVQRTFTWAAGAGSHTIKVVTDSRNEVAESNEDNNDKTVSYLTLAPDMLIGAITWSPENPSIGDKVTFTVIINNRGDGRAEPSYVGYYVDDVYLSSAYVDSIDSQASANITLTRTAERGLHTLRAVIDPNKQVVEDDETNNEKEITFSPLAPDLIIETMTWTPKAPAAGDAVTFTLNIKNQGSDSAGSSRTTYYLDGSFRGYQDIPELEAGASVQKTFSWTAEAGSHAFSAVADSDETVLENDETNNKKVLTLPLSDLAIDDITWSPENPSAGDKVTFTVTIKNRGSGRSDKSDITYFIGNTAKGNYDVPVIEAGATLPGTFSWTVEVDSRTFRAVVDEADYIIESDETNNEKMVNFATVAPDLVVQDISWSLENPSNGDVVTFAVNIKNQGSGRSGPFRVAYYIDDSSRGFRDVPGIDAGATMPAIFTSVVEAGSHILKAVADWNQVIIESDETNNEKTANFLPLAPDLAIQGITWSPENPSAGDKVTFAVTINNQGSGKAGASRVAYYIDGAASGYSDIQELGVGAAVQKTFTWVVRAGSHGIKAVADSRDEVIENDETNNAGEQTLSPVAAGGTAGNQAEKPALSSVPGESSPFSWWWWLFAAAATFTIGVAVVITKSNK